MAHSPLLSLRARKGCKAACMALLAVFLLSACGANGQPQQLANQRKLALDRELAHARSIGVPSTLLQPILTQEAGLRQTDAPLAIFSDQPATTYYTNLDQRYQLLLVQVRGIEAQITQQYDYQATLDIQALERVLAQRQAQGFMEAKTFAGQLEAYQKQMARAQDPRIYSQISANARNTTKALHLMGSAHDALMTLKKSIQQLQDSQLDVSMLNQQVSSDLDLFRQASKPEDFSHLLDLLNFQQQETLVLSMQALPSVGAAKLKQFSEDIDTLKQYGQDTTSFQKRLASAKLALEKAKLLSDFLQVSSQLDSDLASIRLPLLYGQASYLLKQFHQEVSSWGKAHQYHDAFNGQDYQLSYPYDEQGIGADADIALQQAQTPDEYQAVIDLLNDDLLNLRAMEADYADHTPWNQVHQSDLQVLRHYNLASSGQVIVISLVEQSLRLYQNGKLVKAFLITAGQYEKPSLPGFWHIFDRESPTVFKSSEPKGSAFWYPDTNINYAMEYHAGGYFLHDSWWRQDYGPGTNFPHVDSGGDQTFSGTGSHGCINIQEDQAKWLYNNTSYNTAVIIY
ncbi:L,D-transpeptidase [Ktedonosporobacter rubrisoli]|uniref:L,D-transpeptidase n=1 Tax=Ktedonosporobacter rubrisoli TaxID=2509675 RepID=A0A4P6JU43_KTERU|nr:L,D-transpeptidase [Ktedonosporobacter rubrisoli]QBD79138.1 L,D-transpeptidase [Ktedonosporobacter rubrisoli]